MQKRKMGTSRVARRTELEWASFGASDAGLGEELLGMNEFAGDVEAGALSFLASIGKSSVTSEQLRKVTEALFGGGGAHVSAGENSEAGLSSGGHADGAGEPLRAQPAARTAVYKETAAASPFASKMPPPPLQPETRDGYVRGAETRDAYVREGGPIAAAIPPAWPAAGDDYLTSKELKAMCKRSAKQPAGMLPSKADLPDFGWCQPSVASVDELGNQMLLRNRGRPVKLFSGDKVRDKRGVVTCAHYICCVDWEAYKKHAERTRLPTVGKASMVEFYRFVKETGGCGFTMVAQLMDEEQFARLSWRLHPLAAVLDELECGSLYHGSKSHRQAEVDALPKVKSSRMMPLSGRKVCCPTIFRPHTCCSPSSLVGTASSDAASTSAASGRDEEVSLSSATALRGVKNKKQWTRAPDPRWLAHSIAVMKAERGESATAMTRDQVKSMLKTVYGFPEQARAVRDVIQGHHRNVDEHTVTCILQGVRELAQESNHYIEFIYENGTQVERSWHHTPLAAPCLLHGRCLLLHGDSS